VTGAIEQLLVKHKAVQELLDCGPTFYWGLVKRGEIEVVGRRKAGRAVRRSVEKYVEKLRAEASASGKSE
jgi:hypothetical protein